MQSRIAPITNVLLRRPRGRWTSGTEAFRDDDNVYARAFDALLAVYPEVSAEASRLAREAVRLIARSIICVDRVIDQDVSGAAQIEATLTAQVCQLEAVHVLHTIVALDHPFWEDFVARLHEFADACAEEADHNADRHQPISDDVAERIAIGKNALARLVVPLACALGGSRQLADDFNRAITDLIVTVQAIDDATDWRGDLARQRISMITARVWSQLGPDPDGEAARRYVHGVAMPAVLRHGREALARATGCVALQPSPDWVRLTGRIAVQYDSILSLF